MASEVTTADVSNMLSRSRVPQGAWVAPNTGSIVQFSKLDMTARVISYNKSDPVSKLMEQHGFSVTETII